MTEVIFTYNCTKCKAPLNTAVEGNFGNYKVVCSSCIQTTVADLEYDPQQEPNTESIPYQYGWVCPCCGTGQNPSNSICGNLKCQGGLKTYTSNGTDFKI